MKKLFLILFLSVSTTFLFAQGFGIGIKAGANFADVKREDINTSSITGFHAGAYLNLNFSEKWGITPEVLWSQQGSKFKTSDFKTDYVNVPVMLRLMPTSWISLEAGPQFGFLINAKEGGVNIKNNYKNNDFGVAFGAGLHFPLGISAGARYVLGFNNISEVSSEDIKNRTFQVYVGWTLFGEN